MKLLAIVALAVFLNACERPPAGNTDHSAHDHSNANHGTMDHSKMESSPGAAEAPQALQFIDTMIAHHQGAVDMALLVNTRTSRPEMKAFAQKIADEQRKEIAEMQAMRAKWFAESKPAVNMAFPGMSEGMHGMDMSKLQTLKGNEFDIEFIRQMLPHHEGAVAMAKALKSEDNYADLKTLADKMLRDQSAEIEQMNNWLKDWAAAATTASTPAAPAAPDAIDAPGHKH